MAEIVGFVSAAAGFTSLAIQLGSGVDKLRTLYRRSKNLNHDLDVITEDMEYMVRFLPDSDTCKISGSPELDAIAQHCTKRAQTLVATIDKLAKKLIDSPNKRSVKSEAKALLKSRDIQSEIEDLQKAISSLKDDLILARTFIMNSTPQQLMSLLRIENHLSHMRGDHSQVHIKSRSNRNSNSCDRRSCSCSCHIRGSVTRRFWSLEYTPLSMVLQACDNHECTARRHRIAFKWVLTPWGFPLALKFGLDVTAVTGRYSISPSLETERVVRYTSPGFRLLWEHSTEQITLDQTFAGFRELYRKDPNMGFHVNPAGRGYIEESIKIGLKNYNLDDILILLELFVKEFKISLGLNSLSLLYECVSWAHWGSHLQLVELLLHLGLDPGDLPSPDRKQWPKPNLNHDPFYLDLISLLVTQSSDFGSTSPLQEAILTKDIKKALQLLEPANISDVNFLGQSPLHAAIRREDTAFLLLEAGYNPNVRDHNGFTPLMYAAAMGELNVAKMLVTYDADLSIVDDIHRQNFAHFAIYTRHYELLIELLIHIKAKYEGIQGTDQLVPELAKSTIQSLIQNRQPYDDFADSECFVSLLQFIDDVNYRYSKNSTLLHHVYNWKEAEAIMKRGFTLFEEEDSQGETPIMSWGMHRDPKWLQLCLKNGADLNHENAKGDTVLMRLLCDLNFPCVGETINTVPESLSFSLENGAHILVEDHCTCPCAPDGCLPTRVLEVQFTGTQFNPLWTFDVLLALQECGRFQEARHVLLSFIRRSTFEDMGMEHVCCRLGKRCARDVDKESILKRNETKVNTLRHYMESILGMAYDQLEQIWLQQLKRTSYSYPRRFAQRYEKMRKDTDLSSKIMKSPDYSIDEKNDEFICTIYSPAFRLDPKIMSLEQLSKHFLSLESRYRKSLLKSPQWYKRRAVLLFRLINEFGLTINDIVDQISNLKSRPDSQRCYLENCEIEECIGRIHSLFGDYCDDEAKGRSFPRVG